MTGECFKLGSGIQLIQRNNVSSNTIFGAVVVKECAEICTYVGSTTKRIK